ncbi:unnamed protein product [Orchesella dallaii]|uniref:C2H2-type domain-containing protein n=1 Tax=Orchesella dallaii TaxID=48710 RepID=A0ABP1RGD5_9HEXA
MDPRSLQAMETEDIETEVMGNNPVLTLITTEDGIPTSTEVTVLTTALGDVPLMTATLGTLAEVPLTTHPTFVTSHAGMSTVYATSIAPHHQTQHVVVRDQDGRLSVMDSEGMRQAIVVHADPSQLTSALAQAEGHQGQRIMNVRLRATEISHGLQGGTSLVITNDQSGQQQAVELVPATAVLENIHELQTQIIDSDVSTLSHANLVEVGEEQAVIHAEMSSGVLQPEFTNKVDVNEDQGDANISLESTSAATLISVDTFNSQQPEDQAVITEVNEPPAPIIPEKVVCLICYNTFDNPKRTRIKEDGIEEKVKDSTINSPAKDLDNLNKVNDDIDNNEQISYGKSLGKFFEVSRVNMSIVTRRSYKEYEVPICLTCDEKLVETEKIIQEMKQLEKDLYFIRQEIKDVIVESYNSYKASENKDAAESWKTIPGLAEILEVVDRIREDIINDGRPPKIPRSVGRGPGRKPKKREPLAKEVAQIQESTVTEIIPDTVSDIVEGIPPANSSTGITNAEAPATLQEVKEEKPELQATAAEESEVLEDSKIEKPAIRTSFGRLVKRPSYMINDLTEDELSELGESSEDNYEEIEVKPEILTEGETGLLDDEIDEEDPAWSPGRGAFISEKMGIPTSSSEESEDLTDEESEAEGTVKTKIKKEVKEKRNRKSKTAKKKQSFRRATTVKQENVNYEVKVIQIDGTELMTINTIGGDENIGLEPDITQKVMDSQAVIMVKNQLFGKRVQCPHCPRTFTDPVRKDIHVKKKHEGVTKPFECQICQKRFGRQDHLRNHIKRHTRPPRDKSSSRPKPIGEKNHTCEYCDQRFRNKSELAIHRRLHTGERPFKCDHCLETFVSSLKKEFHIEQMHPEVPPLRCDFCPKGFYRQHRLRIHAVSHTGEKTNICEICGKCFSQAAMLRYHQTTHEELNLKQFKCTECSRVFANPQNLKSHVESQHQKMYRHRCETCGRGYTQMSHLRRHLRTHSGEQPFACSYCPKKFTSGAALKIHVRIHTGERPYWCSQCEKGFRSKTKLGRHLKTLIHSGENKDRIKKETTVTTEIETVDVNAATSATWTEIVGIITGV